MRTQYRSYIQRNYKSYCLYLSIVGLWNRFHLLLFLAFAALKQNEVGINIHYFGKIFIKFDVKYLFCRKLT